MDAKALDRFSLYYTVSHTGCWIWHGGHKGHGYPAFWLKPKVVGTHVASYEHFVGPVPAGLEVDHLCEVRSCVNPLHLEAVTHAENMTHTVWTRKTHCPKGHEYNEANTYMNPSGSRQCRVCDRERKR